MSSSRTALAFLALAALALLLAAAATFPAITQTATHVGAPIDHPDTTTGIWWPTAVAQAIAELRWPLHVPYLNWPEGQDTTLVLWSFTVEAMFFPLPLMFDPLQSMNVMIFCILVLNGLACGWAGRVVSGSWIGAAAGVVVGSTCAYSFFEGSWGRPQQALWAPLAIYFGGLVLLERNPGTWKPRLICAASLAMSAAIYWFYGYFLGFLTIVLAIGWLAQRKLTKQTFIDLTLVAVIGVAMVLPLMLPVFISTMTAPEVIGGVTEQIGGETEWVQTHNALMMPTSFMGSLAGLQREPCTALPLMTAPVLLLGVWRGQGPIRWVALLGLAGAVLALGPWLMSGPDIPYLFAGERWVPLPQAWLNYLPGWPRFWWPYRWQAVPLAASGIVAAWGIPRLPAAPAFLVVFGGLQALDNNLILQGGYERPIEIQRVVEVPEIFAHLAAMDEKHPILQVPLATHPNSLVGWQAYHQQPIDGGIAWQMSGVRTKGYEERQRSVPLWSEMERLWKEKPTRREPLQPWTLEDTGGYHYVMMYPHRQNEHDVQAQAAVTAYLGEPFWNGPQVVIWALDGVAIGPEL
ncbi:MAG: hypothetical protein GY913_20675 [Proteobacteria bacterium]|nr:hypothetical protein [Pseudomonadota bacterium]MCP4919323.1 hypothetical protein [Pseudomonadota bacterium]